MRKGIGSSSNEGAEAPLRQSAVCARTCARECACGCVHVCVCVCRYTSSPPSPPFYLSETVVCACCVIPLAASSPPPARQPALSSAFGVAARCYGVVGADLSPPFSPPKKRRGPTATGDLLLCVCFRLSGRRCRCHGTRRTPVPLPLTRASRRAPTPQHTPSFAKIGVCVCLSSSSYCVLLQGASAHAL